MTDDMKLPKGLTCSDCVHFRRCDNLFGCKPTSAECDFSPSGFLLNPQKYIDLKDQLDEAHENLVSMVNQYCPRTMKADGTPETYSHDFMSTGEAVFEYLVTHGLAKWCENGEDIYDLEWPLSQSK